MTPPNFQGSENQAWLEEWLKHRFRNEKSDYGRDGGGIEEYLRWIS
jgi:hypothetical protein